MGRAPCCSKVGLMRGPWSAKEDALLTEYINKHGEGQWRSLPKKAGLLRCGKSCRLRWMNYLRPGIVRGNITEDEDDLIVRLHGLLGNRWSLIAGRLPGRTDNEIKNYWNTCLLKKLQTSGINPNLRSKTPPKSSKKSKNNGNVTAAENNPMKKKKPAVKSTAGQTEREVNGDGGAARVKVYSPKPMRVTPSVRRTESRSSLASSSCNNSGGGGDAAAAEVAWNPAVFELGASVGDYYGGVRGDGDGSDGDGFLSPMGGGDDVHVFDALFDEYLQLLNFDI